MNVEIGTEAAQFPEKEYIIGISLQCMQHGGENTSKGLREAIREEEEAEGVAEG
jgi:hypothetical protein